MAMRADIVSGDGRRLPAPSQQERGRGSGQNDTRTPNLTLRGGCLSTGRL
jgi:hypothetical protein